jgi:hypothetical protein
MTTTAEACLTKKQLATIEKKVTTLLAGSTQQDALSIASGILRRANCPSIIWTRDDFLDAASNEYEDYDTIQDAADHIASVAWKGLTDCSYGWQEIDDALYSFQPRNSE